MAPAAGRPFILVSPRRRLTATDATVTDLGTAPADAADRSGAADRPGVDFRTGSTGSLVRTSLLRNGTGLALDGARGAPRGRDGQRVDRQRSGPARRPRHDDERGPRRAQRRYGVRVTGPSTDRPVTGSPRAATAPSASGSTGRPGSGHGITASGDTGGGVDVEQSGDVTITDLTVADEPAGVFTHVNSTNIVLDRCGARGRRACSSRRRRDQCRCRTRRSRGDGRCRVGRRCRRRAARRHGRRLPCRSAGRAGSQRRHRHPPRGHRRAGRGGRRPGTARLVLQDLRADGVSDDAVRSSSRTRASSAAGSRAAPPASPSTRRPRSRGRRSPWSTRASARTHRSSTPTTST